jgi:molybdate transport system substrate-binding protein
MMKRVIIGSLVAFAVASVEMLSAIADAADIKVISTGSFKEALVELAPVFEKSSGHKVSAIWAGTDEIIKRLGAGETLDIVIAPGPWIDDLTKRGLLATGSRVDVARSGIGVAARAGGPKIEMRSAEDLRKAVLDARSIALSTGVSGIYLTSLFARWGIAEKLEPKIVRLPGAGPVAAAMARGEAEIGFLQVSEWLGVKGIVFVGPLPPDVQEMTLIAAGLNKAAGAPQAAKALVEFLASPEAASAKRRSGLEPD